MCFFETNHLNNIVFSLGWNSVNDDHIFLVRLLFTNSPPIVLVIVVYRAGDCAQVYKYISEVNKYFYYGV